MHEDAYSDAAASTLALHKCRIMATFLIAGGPDTRNSDGNQLAFTVWILVTCNTELEEQ
jgi:hypothetical protein